MMMTAEQYEALHVTELIADLQAINAKKNEYAGLDKKAAQARKDLAAREKKLNRATAELKDVERRLEETQIKNQRDYDVAIKATQAQLHEAWQAEERANRELARINTELRDKRALESGLVAAIAQLQARLEGRPADDIISKIGSGLMHE